MKMRFVKSFMAVLLCFISEAVLASSVTVWNGGEEWDSYETLGEALEAARECTASPKLVVSQESCLTNSFTLTFSCEICAEKTADFASQKIRFDVGALLTVSNGKQLSLKGIEFEPAAPDEMTVKVEEGGTLALAGRVALGTVEVVDKAGLCMKEETEGRILVKTLAATIHQPFATYTCSTPEAERGAEVFANASDSSLVGRAAKGEITWESREISDAEAVLKLNGTENFLSFATLFKHVTNDASVTVLKDCTISAPAFVSNKVSLAGVDAAVKVTAKDAGGFAVVGGTLAVSNLTLTGASSTALFRVGTRNGSDAALPGELIMGAGAKVSDFQSTDYCGAISLLKGDVTMGAGSALINCWATKQKSYGGGIYAKGEGTILRLEDAIITGCSAMEAAGGIAALDKVRVEISGQTRVKNNKAGSVEDDIYSYNSLQVVGAVTSPAESIGLWIEGQANPGEEFAKYDAAKVSNPAQTAAAFFNTKHEDQEAKVDTTKTTFYWATKPDIRTTDKASATVCVIYPNATTNYYKTLEIAFSDLKGDCRIELMKEHTTLDQDLTVPSYSIVLTTDPTVGASALLDRISGTLTVKSGATLTVTNLVLSGEYNLSGVWVNDAQNKLIFVDEGGALVLEKDGGVRKFEGDGSRDASAIVVYKGTFTMKDGSFVDDCRNAYVDVTAGVNTGTGGGVLVDGHSTAYLLGGEIVNCSAACGGGFGLSNQSKAFVSGAFRASGNTDLEGHPSDVMVENESVFALVAPLSESATIGRIAGYHANTNLAATVPDWASQWTPTALKKDAARFFSNDLIDQTGVAVTNATAEALIVWASAVKEGVYVDPNDPSVVYYEITDTPPGPIPHEPVPIAFKSIVRDKATVTLVVTDAVQWCTYQLFVTNTLEHGFTLTNQQGQVIVQPMTNFQWKSSSKEIELTFPVDEDVLFWKAMALPGEETAH